MSTSSKLNGIAFATAAAALFAVAPVASVQAADGAVHCAGINACKGQGACKTAENACHGQNSCKGHGWVGVASAEECTTKGGTVAK